MGYDEPLVAKYNYQRPPWVGIWSCKEYKGRPDWWTEAGAKDVFARKGKLQTSYLARFREEDPHWYDRAVPDGTSLTGPFGLDGDKNPDLTKKGDIPMPLEAFQQKVYEGSAQFKNLAAAFDLSKEHPGVAINPTLNSLNLTPKWQLGRNAFIPNSWYSFGPRFFDQPLNEGTFWKALAAMKYTAILMLPVTMVEIRGLETVKVVDFGFKSFFKRYARLSPLPLAVAAAWAVGLSTAANIRNKDDTRNHLYSSLAVGAVIASAKDSVPKGLTAGVVTLFLGVFWHYARVSTTGLQNKHVNPTTAGIWSGPLTWEAMLQGDYKIPDIQY